MADGILEGFHLAGITHAVPVPAVLSGAAVLALTCCGHKHVFVVDQTRIWAPVPFVMFGVSESGKECLERELFKLAPGGLPPGPPEAWTRDGFTWPPAPIPRKEVTDAALVLGGDERGDVGQVHGRPVR